MRSFFLIPFFVLVLLILTGGCAKQQWNVIPVEPSESLPATKPTATGPSVVLNGELVDEMDFFDTMLKRPRCTVGEAVRAVCLLVNGSDPGRSFDDRYEFLLRRGIVRSAWKLKHADWIDRGTLAYMLIKAGGIKGGVNLRLFGGLGLGDRRYAYREMIYYALMESGCDYQYITGPELITATGNVDRFLQDRGSSSAGRETQLGDRSQYQP